MRYVLLLHIVRLRAMYEEWRAARRRGGGRQGTTDFRAVWRQVVLDDVFIDFTSSSSSSVSSSSSSSDRLFLLISSFCFTNFSSFRARYNVAFLSSLFRSYLAARPYKHLLKSTCGYFHSVPSHTNAVDFWSSSSSKLKGTSNTQVLQKYLMATQRKEISR